MHIAHYIQRYPPALGGSEAYFARLSRYLVARGEQVNVFTSIALDLDAFWSRHGACLQAGIENDRGVEVHRYPLLRWPARRYVLKAMSLLPHRLWQCLTLPCNPICPGMWRDAGRVEPRFDAVHASAFPYAWPIACALRLARRQKIPFLVTPFLHLGDPSDADDRTRRGYLAAPLVWLLRQADAIFVQTPSEHAAVLEQGVAEDKVVLQGLGVDPAECTGGNRAMVRRQWRVADAEVVVGHLANKSHEKGTLDLLEAVRSLWAQGSAPHVVLAGPEMPNFRTFWARFEAELPEAWRSRVHCLDVLTDAEKRDFFAGIDVFALPSRSDSFGLVLLEAWCNGVPNVAYRAGGIADVVRHDVDGLLTPCGDVTSLANAIAELTQDAARRRALGENGRARALDCFRWDDKLNLVQQTLTRLTHAPRQG
jgi:glycosyltransferase involved in cell wall biosynthesis